MNRIVTTLIAILATAMLLSACGGGGETTALTWTGTKQLGASGKDTDAKGIAVDASGKVYVAGGTRGSLDGNTLAGTQDFFLTSYNSLGQKISTKQTGTAGALTSANGVAVDTSGNVYVAGGTSGGLDGNTLVGTDDAFLTKYDKNGNKLFTIQTGTASNETTAESVAVGLTGNVYVAGNTTGGLDGNALAGYFDFFLIKSTSSGSVLYTRQTGTAGAGSFVSDIAVDTGGNAYVTGYTDGGLAVSAPTGTWDFFLIKYDNSNGNIQYANQLGAALASTFATGVALDAGGNAYVTGYTDGGLDGKTLTGTSDAFLIKFDSSGTKVNTIQFGIAGKATHASCIVVDSSGNVYISGYTEGNLDGNTLKGARDLFITKFSPAGSQLFTKLLGATTATTSASGIALDSGGNVYVTGNTTGGLDGNTSVGSKDFFVVKYDPSGNKQ